MSGYQSPGFLGLKPTRVTHRYTVLQVLHPFGQQFVLNFIDVSAVVYEGQYLFGPRRARLGIRSQPEVVLPDLKRVHFGQELREY